MIKEITVNELKQKLDKKENFVFIDCRELEEWNEGHIAGATLVPLSVFDQKYSDVIKDKNAEIIIQCRSGARSMKACMYLMSQGCTNLTNLQGGIMAWAANEFPVVK